MLADFFPIIFVLFNLKVTPVSGKINKLVRSKKRSNGLNRKGREKFATLKTYASLVGGSAARPWTIQIGLLRDHFGLATGEERRIERRLVSLCKV